MPETVELEIETLDLSGDGLARFRGQSIAVPFTIPGERVLATLGRRASGDPFAAAIDILRPSPHRVAPRCQHFGHRAVGPGPCGGCAWQHIDYPEQLRIKTRLVDEAVRDAMDGAPRALATLAGTATEDPWGFRHKVHFVFGSESRGATPRGPAVTMGHYVRGSRRVTPVSECPVHNERGNDLAFRLHRSYTKANIWAAGDAKDGALSSVAIRVSANTPEIMATLVVTRDDDSRLRAATRRALASHNPTAFHLNVHPRGDAYIFGRDTRRISGTERIREIVAGVSFLISPTAFFQTNIAAAEILVRLVLEALPDAGRVLDLYAGCGLFALPLARAGHTVTAVEENPEAVEDGEASLRLNRIPPERCRFIAKPVELALRGVRSTTSVLLDPPREGASPDVLDDVFGRLRPERGVYISCNVATLGRDLAHIVSHGYKVTLVQPVDMFPHTAHVETVVGIERSDRSDRSDRSGRSGRSERSERSGRSERSERSERSGRSERSERSERSSRSDR